MGGELVLLSAQQGSEAPKVKIEAQRAHQNEMCALTICVNKRCFSNINYNLNVTDSTLIKQINQMLASDLNLGISNKKCNG